MMETVKEKRVTEGETKILNGDHFESLAPHGGAHRGRRRQADYQLSMRLETLAVRLWSLEAKERSAYLALLLHAKPSSTASAKMPPLFTPGAD